MLCALDWSPIHAAAFCALFRDLDESFRLSPQEFSCVLGRLCAALRHLEPQEMPPLAHQMLGLCRDHGAASTLLHQLATYFSDKLAKVGEERTDQDDLGTADLIAEEDEYGRRLAILQAEGTIMVHVVNAVRTSHPVNKDVMRWLR